MALRTLKQHCIGYFSLYIHTLALLVERTHRVREFAVSRLGHTKIMVLVACSQYYEDRIMFSSDETLNRSLILVIFTEHVNEPYGSLKKTKELYPCLYVLSI